MDQDREAFLRDTYGFSDEPLLDRPDEDEILRERFGPLVDKFISTLLTPRSREAYAFLADILESGNLKTHKQTIWEVRTEATRAVSEAQRRCDIDHRISDQLYCTNTSACGFGQCPYTRPEHAFDTPPTKRPKATAVERPRRARQQTFALEDAIDTLLEREGIAVG